MLNLTNRMCLVINLFPVRFHEGKEVTQKL